MHTPSFLIGFMGSGKTTLGQKIAKKLNLQFVDLDQKIIEEVGMSIPEYFEKYGEDSFRKIESKVLKQSAQYGNAIISTGGGTPCFYDNMEWMLKKGKVFYLKLSSAAIYSRLNTPKVTQRPALKGLRDGDLLEHIKQKLQERAKDYEKAHFHINPLNNPIKEILNIIQSI